jgi:hypothetical protein
MNPFSSSVGYSARFLGQAGDDCSYGVEETKNGNLARTFTAIISCTQRASAGGWPEHSDERKVERWCKLKPDKLPPNGGTIRIDLSEVQIE